MPIHICYTINDGDVSETTIMNFLKYNYQIKSMVLNLSCLQKTLSTIEGERGTKIPHQIFLGEEMGFNKDPSRTRDHTWSWCVRPVPNQDLAPEV
jgi:hypothetical protein